MIIGLLIGISGVVAVDQFAQVTILANLTFVPIPTTIDFGSLIPGAESIMPVTLTPGTSDLSISVDITGDLMIQGIKSNRSGTYAAYKGDSFNMTAITPITFSTKLIVPVSKKANPYSGTIVYTVLEKP